MEKKWNLQDIRPSEPRRVPKRPVAMTRDDAEEERVVQSSRPTKKTGGRMGILLPLTIVIFLITAGVILAWLTAGAEVTVHPRYREPTVNGVFEAKRQAGEGELAYEVLSLEATGEREVTATGMETVQTQATGKILISNTTKNSERLITNTRFKTPDGLVFRITESVVVPATTDETSGQVVADVFADEAGDTYNINSGTKFTVPGFEESDLDALFAGITAVSQSNFSGGYDGPQFIIDDEQLSTATESLHSELREALLNRLGTERPANFILFDSAVTFSYQGLPSEDIGSGQVKIKEKAILQVPLFGELNLARTIASAVVPGYDNAPVRINNTSAISFEYATTTDNLGTRDSINFNLNGKPQLIWTYDEGQLKADLAGGAETALNTVLGGYPAIEKAAVKIRPFWSRSFPEDPAKIKILEVIE